MSVINSGLKNLRSTTVLMLHWVGKNNDWQTSFAYVPHSVAEPLDDRKQLHPLLDIMREEDGGACVAWQGGGAPFDRTDIPEDFSAHLPFLVTLSADLKFMHTLQARGGHAGSKCAFCKAFAGA